MSKLLEFLLGSVLITVFTLAFIFFSALHYILRAGEIVDCAWQGSVKAWIDSNADGRLNQNEPPLDGVQIYVDEVQKQIVDIRWPVITDKDGDVQFSVSIPGCSDTLYEIYVDIPQGYRMTTNPRIEVHPDMDAGVGTERIYYFGFAPEN